ncbi:MAG: hypothetical protein AAF957_17625 [Planctomycetota bacterium]
MSTDARISSALVSLLALSALAPAGAAQSAPHDPAPRFAPPDHVLHDVDSEGTRWAMGTTYKASAGPDGFQYIPFLGSDAPQNFPVGFRLSGATVDGEPVALDARADVSRSGDVWTLDRGPVDVVYRLALDSVEQIVVLDDVSRGGDVRASFEVAGEYEQLADRGGFLFRGPWGDVHFGAAIALAPDGRTGDVHAERTDCGFDLVVPRAFVDTIGGGPLVIDPVVTTGSVAVFSRTVVSAEVGADADVGYVTAIEVRFSMTDHDIFLYASPPASPTMSGNQVAGIDLSSQNWAEPSVAGRGDDDEFLIVATRGEGAGREIVGRTTSAPIWTVTPPVVLDDGRESYAPDVGAAFVVGFFAENRWLVVWEEAFFPGDRDIQGRIVFSGGAPGPLVPIARTIQNETAPSIGERAGPTGAPADVRFTIAFLREETLGNGVRVVQRDGSGAFVLGSSLTVSTALSTSVDVTGPADILAPNGEHPYLVAYGTRALIGNGRWVRTAVCAGPDLLETTNVGDMSDEGRDNLQSNPVVACNGDKFLVAYEERETLGGNADVVLCSGDLAGGYFGLAERRGTIGFPLLSENGPSIVTDWEGGDTGSSPNGFVGYLFDEIGRIVQGAYVRSEFAEVCGYQYCEANTNSTGRPAWVAAYGDNSTTASKVISVYDAPPGSPCFILVARADGFVPLVGGSSGNLCLGGLNFGRYSNFVAPTDQFGRYELTISPQTIAQPNGTIAAQSGETWYFQGWFRDFDGAVTSNLTNGVAVPFD